MISTLHAIIYDTFSLAAAAAAAILMETGSFILNEDGSKILMEA